MKREVQEGLFYVEVRETRIKITMTMRKEIKSNELKTPAV
jgi:hypothetical protein